uniref:EamA domain-containing protein n=1 Tax=Ostreococcus mediterraneus TaxID=1486918 RepID=A0A7S0T9U9_9CHLO|mmetsp:Transcript_1489/g.4643  ORF Transcript_1489/g.4643 Transcript_1489/m.4643 type:complete len:531 (+) Transcript_1489:357-1949(+)
MAMAMPRRDRVGASGEEDDGERVVVAREGGRARWRRRRRRCGGGVMMTRASSSSTTAAAAAAARRMGGRGPEPSASSAKDYEYDYDDRRTGIRATRVSVRSSGRQFIPSDVLETLPEGMMKNDADVIESSFLDDFVEDVAEGAGAAETRGRRRALERAYETWTREIESMGVSKRTRGLILFAVIMCFYGANITLVKVAQQSMSTDVFAGLRFGVGALVFSPFLKYAARDERVIRGGLELGLWCSLGYYLQNIGLQYTDAARASFISSFTIITVPMLAGLAGREVKSATWGATGIAVAGLAMMENLIPIPGVVDTVAATNAQGDLIDGVSDLIDVVVDADVDVVAGTAASMVDGVASVALDVASGQSGTLVGDLCTLGSALLFGTHIFRTDCIFNGAPLAHKESMGLVCLQMLTVVACFSGLLVYDYVDNAGDMQAVLGFSDWSSVSWSSVFFIGAISTAGCIYLETVAVTLIASQEATLMYSTEPIWGAVFAYFLLGETLSPSASVGAGLILLSTLVGARAVGEETTAND